MPSIVFVHMVAAPSSLEEALAGGGSREGFASGVIIDASGLIVTNAHVVAGTSLVQVQTADGEELEATVLGQDPVTDLALLRVTAGRALPTAPLGRSERLQPGQWVIALGNPVELHHSVTFGIISAVERTLDDEGQEFIQTDASINPGSSGGALFDLDGNLIGITTGMYSKSGEDAGLNFAIPIHVLRDLLPQLKAGEVVHGWIGATLKPIARVATGGLHGRPGPTTLRVTRVSPDGPAAEAGIKVGDVIVGISDVPSARASELLRHLRLSKPGATISFRVERAGHTCLIPVVVAANPPDSDH
jgi:serine protease Do